MSNRLEYHSLIILALTFILYCKIATANVYGAAVVEFVPEYNDSISAGRNMLENAKNTVKYIQYAKQEGADIVVFPEYGLTSLNIDLRYNELSTFGVHLPSAEEIESKANNTIPCEIKKTSRILQDISCAGRNDKIYVVIHVIEKESYSTAENESFKHYSTIIVFDRAGRIISKYRKYTLFDVYHFKESTNLEHPKEPQNVTFTTDFGVTFGILVSYDILNTDLIKQYQKNNITHFVYPAACRSRIPFLTASAIQAGWVRAHGVNLLASSYCDPENMLGGSGIYSAHGGILTDYVPTEKKTNILFHNVTKENSKTSHFTDKVDESDTRRNMMRGKFAPSLKTTVEDMENYEFHVIEKPGKLRKTLSSSSVKCDCEINIEDMDSTTYNYRFFAYQGPMDYIGKQATVRTCGILACLNSSVSSCGVINYDAKEQPTFPKITHAKIHMYEDSILMMDSSLPFTYDYFLHTLPFRKYTFEGNLIMLKENVDKLLVFSIFQTTNKSNSSGIKKNNIFLIVLLVLFIKLMV